jgi:NAD+ synthase
MDYDTLDSILALHIDGQVPKSATMDLLEVDEATVDRVRELHEESAHKRKVPPGPEPLH